MSKAMITSQQIIAYIKEAIPIPGRSIGLHELLDQIKTKDQVPADRIEECIEAMKREGDIYEPMRGIIQRI